VAAADLTAALLAAAFALPPTAAAPRLVWAASDAGGGRAGELRVEGLPPAALARLDTAALADAAGERLLRVVAAPPADDADLARLPNLWGSYGLEAGAIVFRPRHALAAGVELVARFDGAAFDAATGGRGTPSRKLRHRAAPAGAPSTTVVSLSPDGDEIPANLLRLYVHFSAPMSLRDVAASVQLLDALGRPIADAFVAVPEGLWDPERRRLTLLVHPGRIKRGVGPGEAMGPVLREGESVRLVVATTARDADGRPLAAEYRSPARLSSSATARRPPRSRLRQPLGAFDRTTGAAPRTAEMRRAAPRGERSESEPRDARAAQPAERALDADPAALAQTDDDAVVLLEELREALLARLAHVRRARIGVEVVRVDLERHQPERVELGGSTIGMSLVVRIVGQATLIPAEAPSVRHAAPRPARERREQAALLHRGEQAEGVAAADEDGLGVGDLPAPERPATSSSTSTPSGAIRWRNFAA
jgi:hypothetical protein